MVVLIDNLYFSLNTACSVNTTIKKTGSLSKTEENTSYNDDMITPHLKDQLNII